MGNRAGKIFIKTIGSSAFAAIAVIAAIFLWTPMCAAQQKPVAKVNGNVLSDYEMNEALNEILPAASFHGGITPEKRQKYHDRAVDKMIEDELLYQEAVRRGLEVGEDVITNDVDATIKRLGSKERYEEALKNTGLTDEEYRVKIKRRKLIELLQAAIVEESKASDQEAREYYEANKERYVMPPSWRLRHILISVPPESSPEEWDAKRKRAEEALQKIKDGEDMASVAWDYSDDPYRVKGGDLGIVHSGRLVGALEQAVSKLKVGEVSDVVQSIYGYHIVRLEGKSEEEQIEFDDASEKIKETLSREKREKLETELLEKLKADAKIEVY
jgi:peptidyl-prolyl cis-trans isomerase C